MKLSAYCWLYSFSIACGFMSSAASALCVAKNPARGYRFPVVLKIPEGLLGYDVARFEAWSFRAGKWQQIAVQIDEVNRDHSYVLEEGIPYTRDTGTGLTKAVDEISFKGIELGENFTNDKIPKDVRDRFETFRRLDICATNEVYLGSVVAGSTKGVAKKLDWKPLFDRSKRTVATSAYRYVFGEKRPMLIGDVFLKSGGAEYPVFADSTFFMPMSPAFWLLPGIKFDESDFDSEIECWRSGPVRSIVAVGAKMKKFFSIVNLHLFSELVFYEDFFQIPTQIEMTFDADKYLDYGSGLAYILRYPQGTKWDVSSNFDVLPNSPDDLEGKSGKPVKTAREQSPEGVFRAWGTSPEGSFLAQVRVDQKATADVPPPFLVREAMFDQKPWKTEWRWLKDTRGNLGVYLDISQVHKGLYDFFLDLMLSPRSGDTFQDFHKVEGFWSQIPG